MNNVNRCERTKNVKNNIIKTVGFKMIGVVITFVLLPMTVHYLSETQYGLWVTLFTVINWINFLDLGMGIGIRNKLSESISRNDMDLSKQYISTGYIVFFLIGISMFILVLIISSFIDFRFIFNVYTMEKEDLNLIVLVTVAFVIGIFFMSLINQILYACQQAGKVGMTNVLSNLLMLIYVYCLINSVQANLLYFIVGYGVCNVLSYTVITMCFFYKHSHLTPKIQYFDKKLIVQINKVGIKFFIIQISCILMFSSSNIMIAQFLGIEYIRTYDIVFKIFSVITMIHTLISAPLWSAYTDAYIKNDIQWIKKTLQKMMLLMIPVILFTAIIAYNINTIVFLWFKIDINISINLIIGMSLFTIVSTWNNTIVYLLNGISMINSQIYCSIFSAAAIVPMTYFFLKVCMMKSAGIIITIDILLLISGIVVTLNAKKYFKNLKNN